VKANVPWRKNWSFDSRGSLQKQRDRNKNSGGISEVPVQPENPTKLDWNLNSGGISQVPVQPGLGKNPGFFNYRPTRGFLGG
jgi:hypothetical protein